MYERFQETSPYVQQINAYLGPRCADRGWYDLTLKQLPEYLSTLDKKKGRSATTYYQVQKSLKNLVVRAVEGGYFKLPKGWWIAIDKRGHRFLWTKEWKDRPRVPGGEGRLPAYYGYSPTGLLRQKMVRRLQYTSMPHLERELAIADIYEMNLPQLQQKETEFQRIKKSVRNLSLLRKVVESKTSSKEMTLGLMFHLLVFQGKINYRLDQILAFGKSDKRYDWRGLTLDQVPRFLNKLDDYPDCPRSRWTMVRNALKNLVVMAVEAGIYQLPSN